MTTNETDQSAADKVQRTAFRDLLEAAKGVIAGFDSGVFMRNVDHDHEPGWAVKAQPSLLALGNMVNAGVEVNWKRPRLVVLQKLKGRPPLRIKGDEFPIENEVAPE